KGGCWPAPACVPMSSQCRPTSSCARSKAPGATPCPDARRAERDAVLRLLWRLAMSIEGEAAFDARSADSATGVAARDRHEKAGHRRSRDGRLAGRSTTPQKLGAERAGADARAA